MGQLCSYFNQQPRPLIGFQISSSSLSGVALSSKKRKTRDSFVFHFSDDTIKPSLYNKNIGDMDRLKDIFKEGLSEMGEVDRKAALILPELSQKTFVFSFKTIPASYQEKQKIIRFRIKKVMPIIPDDLRISFDFMDSDGEKVAVVTAAREQVVKEYEEFFKDFGIKIRVIVPPWFGLMNLVASHSQKNFMMINADKDSFSLVIVVDMRLAFYRQKHFLFEDDKDIHGSTKAEKMAKEIMGTIHFLEDREKINVSCIWMRTGIRKGDEIVSYLRENCDFDINRIEDSPVLSFDRREKKILAPLIGLLL